MNGQIRAFGYVTLEKTHLYRALMRLFADAKAHFALVCGHVKSWMR